MCNPTPAMTREEMVQFARQLKNGPRLDPRDLEMFASAVLELLEIAAVQRIPTYLVSDGKEVRATVSGAAGEDAAVRQAMMQSKVRPGAPFYVSRIIGHAYTPDFNTDTKWFQQREGN